MIQATLIKDSRGPTGSRLTTFIFKYPRFIHSEVMTHRLLSKNSASSRAIPFKKMVELVKLEQAAPHYWGTEKPGMQSGGELEGDTRDMAMARWAEARDAAVDYATMLNSLGVHKSICNRLLEPFAHMTVIITGDSKGWANFFALRAHPAAQPEFQVLAYRALDAYNRSLPSLLDAGEWHVPFDLSDDERRALDDQSHGVRIKVATGRIARVSYLTHDGGRDPVKDLDLYEKLVSATPPHMSPLEHCACAVQNQLGNSRAANFGRFWLQFRKLHKNERTNSLDDGGVAILANRPGWFQLQ